MEAQLGQCYVRPYINKLHAGNIGSFWKENTSTASQEITKVALNTSNHIIVKRSAHTNTLYGQCKPWGLGTVRRCTYVRSYTPHNDHMASVQCAMLISEVKEAVFLFHSRNVGVVLNVQLVDRGIVIQVLHLSTKEAGTCNANIQ